MHCWLALSLLALQWFSHNGERLGTFSGHNGTVWTIDADSSSTLLVSGSADNTCKLWHIPTGKLLVRPLQ